MNPIRRFSGTPWMIREDAFRTLMAAAADPPADWATAPRRSLAAPEGSPSSGAYRVEDGVGIIPIHGPIYRRSNPVDDFMAYLFGGVSLDAVRACLGLAAADPKVKAILLDIDSPGGMAAGLAEMAAEVRAAAGAKPLAAYSEGMCASAAYYLASAAGEITVSPACMVGSIGTVVCFVDDSELLASLGIREIPVVSSQSPRKWLDPATEAGLAEWQQIVDATAAVFVADVARFRGVDQSTVLSDYGRGGIFVGDAARRAGLVDRVGSFDDVIAKLSGRNRARLAVSRPAATSQGAPGRLRFRPR